MGYCAVSLQLLVILEKCWLGGGGFAFDNWHLLLETDKGLNSPSLGKGDAGEKTQAKLLSVTERWANLFPWHGVKLWHNAPPVLLAPQAGWEQPHRFALAAVPLFVCANLLRFLEPLGWFLQVSLWSHGSELMGQAGDEGMFFTNPSAAGNEVKSVLDSLMFCSLASPFHRSEAS